MSETETPKKVLKKRGRQQKKASVNDNCRFCNRSLTSVGGKNVSFENIFKPSRRQESLDLILADACESIGFKLVRSKNLSDRVCRPCGNKIRNAFELYNFVKKAVSLSQAKEEIIVAEPVSDAESDDDRRIKRQLPSTERQKGFRQRKYIKPKERTSTPRKKPAVIQIKHAARHSSLKTR